MPKLQVCERGPIAVQIDGTVKRYNPGDVFEVADEKEANRLLGIEPAIVQKPGLVDKVVDAVKGKKGKKTERTETDEKGEK